MCTGCIKVKLVTVVIITVLFTFTSRTTAAPVVNVRAAILMDAKTGMILYQANAFARLPPASTTKIMTAIIALENGDLSAPVTASRRAAATEGSSIWLREGETLTLKEMLYGVLLKSGNDACVAVAEHIAGREEEFVRRMNRRTQELGAFNTHFVNSNGLPAREHYSTAYDLATITRHALRDSNFAAIVKTRKTCISWPGETWERTLRNSNKLLTLFEGADGVKTGTTSEAGQCLVASATRNSQQLIAVVLHSDNRWQDAISLLEYGFSRFCLLTEAERGELIAKVPVVGGSMPVVRLYAGGNLNTVVLVQDKTLVRRVVEVPDNIKAPVRAGQVLGSIKVVKGNETLAETWLLAGDSIRRISCFQQFCDFSLRSPDCATE